MPQAPEISVQAWSLPSATGIGMVQARTYFPGVEPILILQVIHGMAEHMDRYDAFARHMAAQGIVVVLSDLPGHGRSAPDEKHLGFAAGRNGWNLALADQFSITVETTARLPRLPVYLYGHSMGSMLASAYLAENGGKLAGAVLSGPAGPKALMPLVRLLPRISVWRHGPYYRDASLQKVMQQGFLDRIKNPASPNDWLSTDPEVVKAYDEDPLCGFCFTSAGFRDLTDLLGSIQGRRWASRVPKDSRILIVAGGEDPVGGYGKGPAGVRDLLGQTGHRDVQMIIYEGERHEPHQGQGREAVFSDIATYLLATGGQG